MEKDNELAQLAKNKCTWNERVDNITGTTSEKAGTTSYKEQMLAPPAAKIGFWHHKKWRLLVRLILYYFLYFS